MLSCIFVLSMSSCLYLVIIVCLLVTKVLVNYGNTVMSEKLMLGDVTERRDVFNFLMSRRFFTFYILPSKYTLHARKRYPHTL